MPRAGKGSTATILGQAANVCQLEDHKPHEKVILNLIQDSAQPKLLMQLPPAINVSCYAGFRNRVHDDEYAERHFNTISGYSIGPGFGYVVIIKSNQ